MGVGSAIAGGGFRLAPSRNYIVKFLDPFCFGHVSFVHITM
jgi:hypothetical protein